jgi:hypothetical protein
VPLAEKAYSRSVEMKRPASLLAAVLFWLIALAQLLRVLLRVVVREREMSTSPSG